MMDLLSQLGSLTRTEWKWPGFGWKVWPRHGGW